MKPVFSGPSGRKPWRGPKKGELEKPGDSTKVGNGIVRLMSIGDDGQTAEMEAVNEGGEVLKFTAHREADGGWGEKILAHNIPVHIYMSELPSFESIKAAGWLDGSIMRAEAVNAHSGPLELVVERLNADLQQTKREAARLKREAARMEVKHHKWKSPTDEEHAADVQVMIDMLKSELKLEKPQGSSLHHFMQFLAEMGATDDEFLEQDFQSIVIEHDWAAAFKGVEGMNDDGEVPLPFDHVCFEFRINGLRLLVMMGPTMSLIATGVNKRWYISGQRFEFKDGKFREVSDSGSGIKSAQRFMDFIGEQIRAACIMLDAEVAEHEEQPPSEALNKQRRARGQVELKSYHVVRLHRKHRARSVSTGSGTGRHHRAHVRRGHWRHFTEGTGREQYVDADGHLRSKTWINWMVVGDINLGFVDKEYRL